MRRLTDPSLRLPGHGPLIRGLERFVQAPGVLRARRALLRHLPFPRLASEVHDIAYLNWWVPVDRVWPLVPARVRLWERDGMTVLTVLTYRHGHFGPTLLGPLRRAMPSPLQSNWRLYVDSIDGIPCEAPTVLFLPTLIDSLLYTVGTRLASDALPLHQPARFEHGWEDGALRTRIAPGEGSAPDLVARLLPIARSREVWPDAWRERFESREEALRFLCLQDRSVVPVADAPGVLAEGTIGLPIDLSAVETMAVGGWSSDALRPWVGDTDPWGFLVPQVPFRVLGERWWLPPG